MTKKDWLIEDFGDRVICLRGVGKMFYQHGFPIAMAITELHKKGIEVSLFHVADECLKNGWKAKTVFNKLEEELVGERTNVTKEELETFCYAEYEDQREMIFNYLYSDKEAAVAYLKHRLNLIASENLEAELVQYFKEKKIEVVRNKTI